LPSAAKSRLGAVERRSLDGEDRLTEIFDFALTRDAPLDQSEAPLVTSDGIIKAARARQERDAPAQA
jgi:hypothetical protein